MKITRIRWAAYCVPFREPYTTSLGTLTQREGLILQLETDDGRVGLGEAAPTPDDLGAAKALDRTMASVAGTLLGREVVEIEPAELALEVAPDVAGAVRAALDVALFQLFPQARHMPLARFLSLSAVDIVPVNALITWHANPAEATKAAVAAGFTAFKLKIGEVPSPAAVRRIVAAAREVIGPGSTLRLDPNGAWSVEKAARIINAVSEYDIEYVEQPIAPGDLDALRRLQRAVDVAIAADEDVTDVETARRIIEMGAARVLVLKPQRLGGIRPCLQVIEEASKAGVRCVVTTSIEAGIGTAACLHLAAALPAGSPACGLATADLLDSELTTPHLPIENGVMRVPKGPGLGVELDEATAAPYLGAWREVS